VLILRGFKSFVLEVLIPKALYARFWEVRIPKDLVNWRTNENKQIKLKCQRRKAWANLKPPESKNASKALAAR
jgi:hypothetical protein